MSSLLILDDDPVFCDLLAQKLHSHFAAVVVAHSVFSARQILSRDRIDYMILDLMLDGEQGLVHIDEFIKSNPSIKILVLTGYASIATAVRAVKLGAFQYLPKPASSQEILNALEMSEWLSPNESEFTMLAPKAVELEYIQRKLQEHDGNISATARALNMHRRTLQRKLEKKSRH